jgi:hypothetical protein
MNYVWRFLGAFARTEIIEISVLFLLVRLALGMSKKKISHAQLLFVGFLTSFATIPWLWFVLPRFVDLSKYILLAELGIVLVEAVIINRILKIKFKQSFAVSLVCNSASYFFGKLLFLIIK